MKVQTTPLAGLLLLEPRVFADARGYFLESYNAQAFAAAGIATVFVQDNQSRSCRGTLRGMHYQAPPHAQDKLVRVVTGEVFDVAVDLRPQSATYRQWFGVHLSADNHCMLYVPQDFAHGFCVLSDVADVLYKTGDFYDRASERGFAWNDPEIGIAWPVREPILSDKDRAAPLVRQLSVDF